MLLACRRHTHRLIPGTYCLHWTCLCLHVRPFVYTQEIDANQRCYLYHLLGGAVADGAPKCLWRRCFWAGWGAQDRQVLSSCDQWVSTRTWCSKTGGMGTQGERRGKWGHQAGEILIQSWRMIRWAWKWLTSKEWFGCCGNVAQIDLSAWLIWPFCSVEGIQMRVVMRLVKQNQPHKKIFNQALPK